MYIISLSCIIYTYCKLILKSPSRRINEKVLYCNIPELLVYYLMPNKCKNLKDMKSSCLSIYTSSPKITKVDISCVIRCDSAPLSERTPIKANIYGLLVSRLFFFNFEAFKILLTVSFQIMFIIPIEMCPIHINLTCLI